VSIGGATAALQFVFGALNYKNRDEAPAFVGHNTITSVSGPASRSIVWPWQLRTATCERLRTRSATCA
jgi:hypothetical protein